MIRIVTYNVSGGVDPGAVAEVLAELEPRIVCVQERPSTKRLRRIGRGADLEVAARAGRRGTGTAVLVHRDVAVRSTTPVPLATPRDVPTREATNVIALADGLRLSVTAVQLGLRPEVRRTNLDELLRFLVTVGAPTVIGCDLNESVRSPVASALADGFHDAFATVGTGPGDTYPTSDPSTRQDYLFVDRSLTLLGCHVASGPTVDVASHHRPVVVDLAGRQEGTSPFDRDDRSFDASAA